MTERVIIFMPLRDEGVDVWRPIEAEPLHGGRYRVLGPVPQGEVWVFPPDTIVLCEWQCFADGNKGLTVTGAA